MIEKAFQFCERVLTFLHDFIKGLLTNNTNKQEKQDKQ
jgi:hypothetical protein